VPTPTSTAATLAPSVTPSPAASTTATATAVPPTATPSRQGASPLHDLERFGVAGALSDAVGARRAGLTFGSYLNWNVHPSPPLPPLVTFWHVVRVGESGPWLSWEALAETVAQQPGAIWIVGNEPDVAEQDNIPPQRYAELYHDVYTFIKQRDPTALLVIGGVSQPTPLRRRYLERVLDSYEARYGVAMPIDIWNVHAFILREERDNWGVGIPLGMADETGELYEIDDHADLAIFRQNIIDFRAWMAERGYADRPLVVSEYGILLPADYGFAPEIVTEFLHGTMEFFMTAANETGYAPDNNRLVQWWFWYSVYDESDFPTGNLYHRPGGQLTLIGLAYTDFVDVTRSR
jgi:hypothetical protein